MCTVAFSPAGRWLASGSEDLKIRLLALGSGRGFRDLMDFCDEVEGTRQRRVDVVVEDGLSPYIRERVLEEAVAL